MALKKAFDRQGILIYPWYVSDVVATRGIGRISGGRKIKKVFMYIDDNLTNVYYEKKSTDALGRWLLTRIIKDKKFYHLVIKKIYSYSDQLLDFCANLKKTKPTRLSDRELLKIYSDYEKKLGELRIWGWVPVILDGFFEPFFSDYLMKDFLKFLNKHDRAAKIADYYSLLSTSEKMSEVQVESLARLKLLIKISQIAGGRTAIKTISAGKINNFKKKFSPAGELIAKHLKKFGWLTYSYAGPVMSFEYLFKVLKSDLRNGDLGEQLKKINEHFRSIKIEKINLRKDLKLPGHLTYLFDVSADLMFIKDYRKGVYQKSYVAMDKIIGELAKRLGVSNREIRNLVLEEVQEALLNNKISLYQARAAQRTKLGGYMVADGKIKAYEGSQLKKFIARFSKEDRFLIPKTKELKGSIAYSGLARGRAKIILNKNDVSKLKLGDILISSATNPDLISAMKRAAAFVTDTGGIICHAAIIARELKKPCIIGTKIATQILHDGDLIEVDANRGVVRILNK